MTVGEPGVAPVAVRADAGTRPTDLLAALWERHHGTNAERVAVLESAALALLDGALPHELRDDALLAAHKLAGSLGTFGFDEGTRIARSAEELLNETNPDPRELSELVVGLIDVVGAEPVAATDPLEPALDPAGDADGSCAGDVLFVSADAMLTERLQVAVAAGRRSLRGATSIRDAEAELRGNDLAVLIVDLAVDGDAAIDFLGAAAEAHPHVRAIAMSDTDTFDERIRAARAGAQEFIPRDVSPDAVLGLLADDPARQTMTAATIAALGADPEQLDLLETLLAGTGIDVRATSDPAELWEILEHEPPAAVLLEFRMPDIDGLVVCRAIRAVPRWQHLPVVFLAADPDAVEVFEMFAVGGDDHLATPLDGNELVTRIRSHVERHRRTTSLVGIDPLTGVANRRLSDQRLGQLTRLAGRRAEPFCVAVIEIDDHDRIGRRHGVAMLERVMRTVADVLREGLRSDDVVGRWTDERFVLGLYGAEREDAAARIAAMIDDLRDREITGVDGAPLEVRMSAGLAEFPTDGSDLWQLLAAADRALRRAMRHPGSVRPASSAGHSSEGLDHVDVVIVDDDEMLADLLVHSLETAGLAVRHLTDGVVAAELLGNGLLRTRLVLLDVGIPGMDGFSVLRVLRDRRVLATTDVVMITARTATSETLAALEIGAVDLIGKPFNVPVLMERIEKILDRSA